jgi:3-oxoacyl-[acyl-carrier-protein] synthase-3
MALITCKNVKISGFSACVPKNVESNYSYSLFSSEDAIKFITSTGVENRRIADKETTTADLCVHAAEQLIKDLGWSKEDINSVVFVSQTPDYILPATSCIIQERLGLSQECYALDISSGCSGWVYGLNTIASLISQGGGTIRKVLLLTGDTPSKMCSKNDKSAWPLFGDAGTATAVEFSADSKDMHFHFGTDGSGYDAIIIPDGGYRNPFNEESLGEHTIEEGIIRNKSQLVLQGMDVFAFGIDKAPKSIVQLQEFFTIDDKTVDYYIFHQANLFMNEKIRKKLKLPQEKVPYSLKNFGNTSSASIPLTIVTELQSNCTNKPQSIIACGFGVGLSWGSVHFSLNSITCSHLIEV